MSQPKYACGKYFPLSIKLATQYNGNSGSILHQFFKAYKGDGRE